jgi:cell division protein FtsB
MEGQGDDKEPSNQLEKHLASLRLEYDTVSNERNALKAKVETLEKSSNEQKVIIDKQAKDVLVKDSEIKQVCRY